MEHARLLDVFYLGPMQILISTYVDDPFLKMFMCITGIANILYNGHNYLYIDRGVISKSIPLVDEFHGKTQLHRLYNLCVMYPVFYFVYTNTNIPPLIKKLFLLNIVLGFSFNLFNFVKLL
jgi:hypothetical protein